MKNNNIRVNSPLPQYTYRQGAKKEDVKVYKRIGLIFVAFLIIVVIVVFMGTAFLNALGTIFNGKKDETPVVVTDTRPLQEPKIDKLPSFTNQSPITVTGTTSPEVTVTLTVNDKPGEEMKTDTSGSFSFATVSLDEGLNLLKVTAKKGEEELATSATITLDKTKPALTVSTPVDNANYPAGTKTISVSGTTESSAKVYINSSQAVVDSTGKFSFTLSVNPGGNSIEVKALDSSQNPNTINLTITVGS